MRPDIHENDQILKILAVRVGCSTCPFSGGEGKSSSESSEPTHSTANAESPKTKVTHFSAKMIFRASKLGSMTVRAHITKAAEYSGQKSNKIVEEVRVR